MANEKKSARIVKTVVSLIALAAFAAIAICQFYEEKILQYDNESVIIDSVSGPDSSLGASLAASPAPMGDMIGVVSAGRFTVVSPSGATVTEEGMLLSDPIVRSKGSCCVVGDYGGKTVTLYEKDKSVANIDVEGEIISLATNSNGFFAVAAKQMGYDAVITVYRKSGEAIYRYNMSGEVFADMDISENNKKLVIASADLSSGVMGRVTVVNFSNTEPECVINVPDTLYFALHFNKNGSFICQSAERVDIYKTDGVKSGEIDYSNETLTASDITEDDMIALAFAPSAGSGARVRIYTKTGKLRGEAQLSESASYICVNSSYIAVSHADKTDIVTKSGKVKKTLKASGRVKYAAAFSDGKSAVVFAGGRTEILK